MSVPELAFLQALAFTLPEAATVVEVGSWKGRSTVALCEALEGLDARVFAVDAFSGVEMHAAGFGPEMLDTFLENTVGFGFLEPIVGGSAESATRFPDGSVDLVFLDADHSYEAVRRDIRAWLPKLKRGGVMCGHDWGFREVIAAVKETFGRPGVFEAIWFTRNRPGLHPVARAETLALRGLGRLSI